MEKLKKLLMEYLNLFIEELSWFTILTFGESRHSLDWFKNITREWYETDPKYPSIQGYRGKRTMFAVKNKKGKLKDVPCLIVNNRFVILDPDTKRRKYVIW